MRSKYTSEFSDCAIRYVINDHKEKAPYNISPEQRLILVPLSWTGISREEVMIIPDTDFPIYTVPIETACASFMRIACREARPSKLRRQILQELCGIITYRYFDMSYEGDYMKILSEDVPRTEKEVMEMENALQTIKGWRFRDDEVWMRDALVQILKGNASYDDLPWGTREAVED